MNLTISATKVGIAAMTALALGSTALASTYQSVSALDVQVAETIGASIGEPGGARAAIDSRLRLAKCPSEPKIEGPVFGAAIVRCESLGWRIRVPLTKSSAFQYGGTASRKPEILVRRGQNVTLTYKGAGFSLSRQMIADQNGALGDMIRVRQNHKSFRVLAEVTGNGQVILPSQ